MLETPPTSPSNIINCAVCGTAETRARAVQRGPLQFCMKCAREMAAGLPQPGRPSTLWRLARTSVVFILLAAGVTWWAKARGQRDLAAARTFVQQAANPAAGAQSPVVSDAAPGKTEAPATPESAPVNTATLEAAASRLLPAFLTEKSRRTVDDVGNLHLLFVSAPNTDGCLGFASRLYATREAPTGDPATLVTQVGSEMKTSFDEGVRYVRKLPRGWEREYSIRLSFEDKFTPKDGGSAGTGFTVAMLAAIQNLALDPDLALTGDLTIDGSVQPVGAVVEKLRGAIAGHCTITLIPERNATDAQDLALLDGTAPLWETQIFSIATIDEALGLARRDRAAATQAAIDRFHALRARLPAVVTPNYLPSPIVQSELKAVLELAPHHLSAAILLKAGTHQLGSQLSLERSIDEILTTSYLFLQDIRKKNTDSEAGGATRSGVSIFPEQEYIKCMNRLYALSALLDPRAVELKTACIAHAGALRALATYQLPDISGKRTVQQWNELARQEKSTMQQCRDNYSASCAKLLLTLRKFGTDESLRRDLRK